MREIKFRAFDTFQGKYVFEGFHVIGEVTAFGGIDSVIRENPRPGKGSLEALNDFILEQFTGLKDKNGKDIYEGDILRLRKSKFKRIVCFYMDSFVARVKDKKHICVDESDWEPLWKEDGQWKIIGNIHENTELLK
jgi:uncharacterized phage protein (TIGR01671 family)